MKLLNQTETLQELCRLSSKPGMFIAWVEDHLVEVVKAAPYLKDYVQAQFDGSAYMLFKDEREMMRYYRRTVGDDGPTKQNPYDGPARVYALTCGADGELQTENT